MKKRPAPTPGRPRPPAHAPLLPLFLVSLVSIGFEIALTRYFAIASWSEYGYWVISITMVGLAASGVVLSLFKDQFVRFGRRLLHAMPMLLMISAAAGYYLVVAVPFNPLEFQNPDQWADQLLNIGKYYAVLFPFFFLTGCYIGLYFLLFQHHIPKIYGADLAGAGVGALVVLLLMFWVNPFYLLAALLPFLAAAGLYHAPAPRKRRRVLYLGALALLLLAGEAVVVGFNRADFNEYKSIYPALHAPDSRIVQRIESPRGHFLVLDNFTERLDIDLSNNFAVLGAGGPPRTYGLYSDGNRITSLARDFDHDRSYVRAALDAFPYRLKPAPRVLLIGTRGGFRLQEALDLGATEVVALEPEETLYGLVRRGLSGSAVLADGRVTLSRQSPAVLAAHGDRRYDLIDIASDFLGQAEANKFAFTVEAMQGYYRQLAEDGVVSIPVSIREFTVYAVKTLETARRALAAEGVERPQDHILVYRSSWNARILVARAPFAPEAIARLRTFCAERSFDTSYYPGIDPERVQIWNDLPQVSFSDQTVVSASDRASDALMEEALRLFSADAATILRPHLFNLEPSTYDRPFFYNVLDLQEIGSILQRIALIPREEIGHLINLAVLLQSLLFALAVLGLPLIRWRHARPAGRAIAKSILYFAGLGLGFLFLEILLIEKASFFLNDRTQGFAIVLTAMLVFSGLGSYASGAWLKDPRRGITLACAVIAGWIVLALAFLDALFLALLGLPAAAKSAVLLALIAPLAVALGFPFPLGLALFRGRSSHFLPWAWSLNGAFSVISTPLANLLAVSAGYKMVLVFSLVLYIMVYGMFPAAPGRQRIH